MALALGSPPLDVIQHLALRSSDFPQEKTCDYLIYLPNVSIHAVFIIINRIIVVKRREIMAIHKNYDAGGGIK